MEQAWDAAGWSAAFVDIEGQQAGEPVWSTRVKLLWDDDYLYIGAKLEEPHVWATLKERDAVIYQDNDFEVFIDPDGDTHNYYELEINALGTVWDLFLVRPYRDGGPAVHSWDIRGLRSAVAVQGTLNDPSDRDVGWTVELALPWMSLARHAPEERRPKDGDHWRMNFSRVQWHSEPVDGTYRKVTDARTGQPLPEENWVWSPQGAVNMHMPEMWGVVQFSELTVAKGSTSFEPLVDEQQRWALRRIYYAQRDFHHRHGRYATSLSELDLALVAAEGSPLPIEIDAAASHFQATTPGSGVHSLWHIDQDGRIWRGHER